MAKTVTWRHERDRLLFQELFSKTPPPPDSWPRPYLALYQQLCHGQNQEDFRRFLKTLRSLLLQHSPPARSHWLQEICVQFFTLELIPFCHQVIKNLNFGFFRPLDGGKAPGASNRGQVNINEYGPDLDHSSAGAFTLVQRAKKPEVQVKTIRGKEREFNCLEKFEESYQTIDRAPRRLKQPLWKTCLQLIQGSTNCCFDPYRQENTPFLLFQLTEADKPLTALRLGTPTCERFWSPMTGQVTVNPEFIGFLQAQQRQGKRHLYINLQKRLRHNWFFSEAPRSNALEKLLPRFPNTFFLISLAKNSRFYHQKNSRSGPAEEFKKEFLEELESDHYFFSIPWSQDARFALLNEVHTHYFDGIPLFTRKEKEEFIDLAHLEIERYFITRCDVDSFNITCRDGIDRAGIANALLYIALQSQEERTPQFWQMLETILFAPALLVKKRTPRRRRFLRFLSAAQRLLSRPT